MSETIPFKTIKDLPSPKGKIIIGNLAEFKQNNKHRVFEKWAKECGDIYAINLLGKKFIVSLDPDFNFEVLKARPEKFRRYAKINEVFIELGINGVFNAEGTHWYKHRKVASEALNAKNVKKYFPIIQTKTAHLLNQLHLAQDKAVDVQKLFMRFTIDITTEIAFGYELNTLSGKADRFQTHLEQIFPAINRRISAPFPIWRYYKSKKEKSLIESLNIIEDVIHQFIEKAENRLASNPQLKENPSNFLEALLVEASQEQFSKKEVFGNIFTMLLAGEDTTSNSLSWALYFLCQNQEWVNKAREEAEKIYAEDCPPDNDVLSQLKIANAIAQEAMRMRPTTPQLFLQANEKTVVKGISIEKDQVVMLQNMHAQNDENHFKSADKFKPERWLTDKCPYHEKHSPQVMRAFGAGPRFCPGMKLATNEMVTAISAICKNFDLRLEVPLEDVKEHFAFTMHPQNLKINFIPVNKEVN